MSILAYSGATSVVAGGRLRFHLARTDGGEVRGEVTVVDATTERVLAHARVDGGMWELEIPDDWPSSLYRAVFDDGTPLAGVEPLDHEAWFVVRAARPGAGAPILVSVPFATWQAYNRSGVPGQGLYYAEQPDRAARVGFDRPGGGPPPERWEEGLLRWLRATGRPVEFCSGLDLHGGDELLSHYRLLVINGHDEYWSREQRDTVEDFVRGGGNLAIFAGNTAWWQMRLEDDGRTMVCHRDAVADPMSAIDPERVTVEWSSAPVNRPENTMTGLSFRRGAGAWGEGMKVIREEAYIARFTDHWVFAGTGLADGDKFAQGALGYETDAAELDWSRGVPRATGRDGTPPTFVVLATADLRHWARYGQGGDAVMGTFRLGAGTVFNAGTINWGSALADPVVDRVTRNVLDRLAADRQPQWEVIGPTGDIRALAACEDVLFGVDTEGALVCREVSGQNLPWRAIGIAGSVVALAAAREASGPLPLVLYAVTADGRLLRRAPVTRPAPWTPVARLPADTIALALCDGGLFAVSADDTLHHVSAAELPTDPDVRAPWRALGSAGGAIALTAMNGRLYAADRNGRLATRPPVTGGAGFAPLAGEPAEPGTVRALTGHAGSLIATAPGARVRRRAAVPVPAAAPGPAPG
ncbi:N,N-dimethylformamidase beta subunit family domain-containing protein [Embleya sp. NPDC127516]|uniref:N,N-dimethylformamidase beta subunit family domain-containing protein n=1 Tax=Embleya sp. NPDC127516 TaxID=3363990 RepID=UPI0038294DB5